MKGSTHSLFWFYNHTLRAVLNILTCKRATDKREKVPKELVAFMGLSFNEDRTIIFFHQGIDDKVDKLDRKRDDKKPLIIV